MLHVAILLPLLAAIRQWTCHSCLWDPRTEDDMRRLSHHPNGTARRLQIPGIGGGFPAEGVVGKCQKGSMVLPMGSMYGIFTYI